VGSRKERERIKLYLWAQGDDRSKSFQRKEIPFRKKKPLDIRIDTWGSRSLKVKLEGGNWRGRREKEFY